MLFAHPLQVSTAVPVLSTVGKFRHHEAHAATPSHHRTHQPATAPEPTRAVQAKQPMSADELAMRQIKMEGEVKRLHVRCAAWVSLCGTLTLRLLQSELDAANARLEEKLKKEKKMRAEKENIESQLQSMVKAYVAH